MDLTSVSLGAANTVTQNYAALGAQIQAVGENATPSGISAQDQGTTQAEFSMGVLKKVLDVQASAGAQLAAMIGQGSGIDIQA